MLKINDNVKLKELEESGFINSDDGSCLMLPFGDYEGIVISKETGRTSIFVSGKDIVSDNVMEKIYDLVNHDFLKKE